MSKKQVVTHKRKVATILVGAVPAACVNGAASTLDQARQMAFECKSLPDAGTDLANYIVPGAVVGKLGDAAKATVKQTEASKKVFDRVIDGYSFGFTSLITWVAEKIVENQKGK
jgi:hypothetical protein